MKTKEMLKRLLWKEMRESYLVYAALFLIPIIIFPMRRSLYNNSSFISGVITISAFLIPLLVVFWGSEKGMHDNLVMRSQKFILPITPIQSWIISFLVHAVILAFLGFWYLKLFLEFVNPLNYDVTIPPSIGISIFVSIYAISYNFTSAFTRWTGMLLGILWMIVFSVYLSSKSKQFNNNEWMWLAIIVFCFILATLSLQIFRKKGAAFVRRISLTLFILPLIIVCILAVKTGNYFDVFMPSSGSATLNSEMIKNNLIAYKEHSYIKNRIRNQHLNNRSDFNRKFKGYIDVISLQDKRYIMLLNNPEFSVNIKVLKWDAKTNKIEKYMQWRRFINPLQKKYLYFYLESPSGKYTIIKQESAIGDGNDLILIDLNKKQIIPLLVDKLIYDVSINWVEDIAYISGNYPAVVDARKHTITPLKINLPDHNKELKNKYNSEVH